GDSVGARGPAAATRGRRGRPSGFSPGVQCAPLRDGALCHSPPRIFMSHDTLHAGPLTRGLKNRHIQLIALGGAIGTGLFLGSAGVMKSAGPSMILGYAIGGLIAFLIMRQLGEMIVQEPVAGSFSHF